MHKEKEGRLHPRCILFSFFSFARQFQLADAIYSIDFEDYWWYGVYLAKRAEMIGMASSSLDCWLVLIRTSLHSLDHVLGRPSTRFRKIQVFAVVSFWSVYLLR